MLGGRGITTSSAIPANEVRLLRRLTGLRAFAALAVFMVHLYSHDVASLPWGLSDLGGLGVPFFFVLSGFVLAWGTEPGLSAWVFYRRRFARIYPSDFAVLLVAAVVPVVAVARSWSAAAANASMTQAWFRDGDIVFGMNGVSWSLSCEAFFYTSFPVVALLVRYLPRVTGWAIAVPSLGLALLAYQRHPDFAAHMPIARFSEFLCGVVAGIAYRDGWRLHLGWAAVAIILLLSFGLAKYVGGPRSFAVMSIPFLLLILYAANLDIDARPGWLCSPALVFAGEVSFAFYLVHELVIVNLIPLLPHNPDIEIPAMLFVAIACALALHFLVERPCNRLLRDKAPSLALAEVEGRRMTRRR